jgi:hypothetical protein
MSQMSIVADHATPRRHVPEMLAPTVPTRLRIAGIVLRTIFILSMLIVTMHVSMPQSSAIWWVYDTPADLLRVIVGCAACLWLVSQLFAMPRDRQAHLTWIYLGMTVVPFALICIVGIW